MRSCSGCCRLGVAEVILPRWQCRDCACARASSGPWAGPIPCCYAPMSKKGRQRFEGAKLAGSADGPRSCSPQRSCRAVFWRPAYGRCTGRQARLLSDLGTGAGL